MLGSIGAPEFIFILLVALLIFGPRKLPEIGRTLGKGLGEFRRATNELKRTLDAEMIEEEIRKSDPRRIIKEELSKAAPTDSKQRSESAPQASDEGSVTASGPAADEPVARGQLDNPAADSKSAESAEPAAAETDKAGSEVT